MRGKGRGARSKGRGIGNDQDHEHEHEGERDGKLAARSASLPPRRAGRGRTFPYKGDERTRRQSAVATGGFFYRRKRR